MMRWTTRWMWIAIALGLGGSPGCGKDDAGPPCTKVAEHVNEIVSKAYPGHGEMMPASSRKAYAASCEARKLTGKQRRCLVEAQSLEGLAACLPKGDSGDKPGAGAVPGAPPSPGGPPPPGAGAPGARAPASGAPAAPPPSAAPAAPSTSGGSAAPPAPPPPAPAPAPK